MASPPTTTDLLIVLTRVETKLDTVIVTQQDHEARIRILERARWPLPSIAVLISLSAVVITAADKML
jgi:hypothetical protein